MSITFDKVTYTYRSYNTAITPALRDVSLDIGGQEAIAVLGPSGSGRSTLLLHMNGLLKPTEGRVLVDGVDITLKGADLLSVRRRIGLLMQSADDQLFGTSVAADVAFGPTQAGSPPDEIEQRVLVALHNVGMPLSQFGDTSPFALSGGQRRRVAIAGILAMRPAVLALDEPLAGLDPLGRADLCATLKKVRRSYNLTMIMATKDVQAALLVAERFIVLERGSVLLDTDREGLLREIPRLAALGLDLPTHERVVLGLRDSGWALPAYMDSAETAADAISTLAMAARP